MSDPFVLNKLAWEVAEQAVEPVKREFVDGTVVVVSGNTASVDFGTGAPTQGVVIAPGDDVEAGDHVLCLSRGGWQLVVKNLSRGGGGGGGTGSGNPHDTPVFFAVDYGAKGNGTDDRLAIQNACDAAAAAGGGIVVLTLMHTISGVILVPSNVTLRGIGWGSGLVASEELWSDTDYLVANEHWSSLPDGGTGSDYPDENIAIENMCLDYGNLGPDGNFHALEIRSARHVRVRDVLFECRGNGDAVAGLHVDDFILEGCTAFDFANCAWDFWTDPSNVVIAHNYAETAMTAQIINFNPEPGTTAIGLTAIGNTCVYTDSTSCANILGPLAAGGYAQDVVFVNNRLVNNVIVVRGDIRRAIVQGNIIESPVDLPAIFSYTSDGGSPVGFVIAGNAVFDPAVDSSNLGVIRAELPEGVIANNVCQGGDNAVPFIYVGSQTPAQVGNNSDTDATLRDHIPHGLTLAGGFYPSAEAGGRQTSGALWHSTGVPSNANGGDNDWCVSDNGKLYNKQAGAWVLIADGGASTHPNLAAHDSLGLATQAELDALASVYQPLDADLTAIAALSTTPFGRSLLAAADAAALRLLAAAVIGTNVQGWDADLDTIAALGVTNDSFIQGKSGAWAKRTVAQVLADLAAAGTTFQPLDSDLTAIGGLTPSNDDVVQRKSGAWTNRTSAQLLADLAALGTTFQPLDSDLTAFAGLSSAVDKLPYFTGAAAMALAEFTAKTAWTPALKFGGGNTGMTTGAGTAGYWWRTRDGIYIVGRITLTAKGSSAGTATIDNLPVASGFTSPAAIGFFANMTLTGMLMGSAGSGTAVLTFRQSSAGGSGAINDTHFTSTSDIVFSLFYPA